jgi:hypothetical protein
VTAPAVASTLAFDTLPANNAAGSTLSSFVVSIKDQYGNPVTTKQTITLKLTDTSTSHTLIRTTHIDGTAKVTTSNGTATFTGLALSNAGTYTLTAFDGALHTTSANFNVTAPAVASNLVFSTQPSNVPTGATAMTSSVVVQIQDQYHNVVTSDHSRVKLQLAGTNGTLIGTPIFAYAADGVATFSNLAGLHLSNAGTFTLKAFDGALNKSSNSFTVSAPVATSLEFSTQPATSIVAGAVGLTPQITVHIKDQFGQDFNSTSSQSVTLQLVGTNGSDITGSFVTVNAANGVATFTDLSDLHLTVAGTGYSLKATLGNTSINVVSDDFNITAAAASKLAFTQTPTANAAHAGPFTLVVNILDQYNNIVTGDTSVVTITTATLPAGATALNATVSAVAGVATLTGVTFSHAGDYTLNAADGALTAVTTPTITLT